MRRQLFTFFSAVSLALVLSAASAGCGQKVRVAVFDAESGRPVERARVCVEYAKSEFDPFQPKDTCVTVIGGSGALRVVNFYLASLVITAEGYLPGSAGVSSSELEKPEPRVQVHLYRRPAPEVLLTLPDGYTGVVKVGFRSAEARVADDHGREPYRPGERLFAFDLTDPEAMNWFPGSPLLLAVAPGEFTARYADGTPLPTGRRGHPESAALRPLESYGLPPGRMHVFFVGTERQTDEFTRREHLPIGIPVIGPTLEQVEEIGTAEVGDAAHTQPAR